MKSRKMIAVFAALAVIQLLLYAAFMAREVAWNYNLHGDPTWYVYFNYKIYQAVVDRTWDVLWQQTTTSPWGIVLFLETLIPQFLFGPSRFSVGVINLMYFLLAQAAVYVFFARLTRAPLGGVIAVAVLMAMQTPFRGDGPGLNIADFHFDLVLFFLLVILHLMVAWSNSFALRGRAIATGLVAGALVATRLVSFFLLSGVLGVFGLVLLYRWWRAKTHGPQLARQRLAGFGTAMVVYAATAIIPLAVAARALYDHYFRFVFDEKFSADRAGMYVMGATSKFGEAYELVARMLMFDFGAGYWPVVLVAIVVAFIGVRARRLAGFPEKPAERGQVAGDLAEMLADREARNTVWVFLLVSGVTSYLMHLVFPIKSDHLTRITAAPILIALTLLIAPCLVQLWRDANPWRRRFARISVFALVASAALVQLAFYTGPGRMHGEKSEMVKVQGIFADISQFVTARGLREIAISVDRVTSFELGAMLSMAVYDFERNGRLLNHTGKLGGIIDETIDLEKATQLVGASDVILIGTLPLPKSGWPFMKSLSPVAAQVHRYVEENFCLYANYTVFGESRRLYVSRERQAWRYSASASTDPNYGPDGLLEGRSRIWHAPWKDRTPQWVEFQRDKPVKFSTLTVTAQDGGAPRAPRDFTLEAYDAERGWVRALGVKGADFSRTQKLSWPVALDRPYSRFRILVTANAGDPTFMTIQELKIDVEPAQLCPPPKVTTAP